MQNVRAHSRFVLGILLCLSLAAWSMLPFSSHSPVVFETIHEHLEMVESHGHSHGFEEDLFWAMHGHSHDVMDHDHSQAFLASGDVPSTQTVVRRVRYSFAETSGPSREFRIDRPPRA